VKVPGFGKADDGDDDGGGARVFGLKLPSLGDGDGVFGLKLPSLSKQPHVEGPEQGPAAEPGYTEKQAKVLEAAMAVFADRGFSAASTSEIAKAAGVASGTVFRFYRTKKDLLLGVVTPVFRHFVAPQFVAAVRGLLEDDYEDLSAFLRVLLTDRMQFVRRHRLAVRIALQETPLHPELRALWQETVVDELEPLALDAVHRLQEAGLVRGVDPGVAARTVLSVLAGFLVYRFFVLPEADWNDEAEIEALIDVLVGGLGA
jgi:AcrR family transcriptional regulator